MPSRTPLIIAGIALAIPILLPLMVWTYARPNPAIGGIPFYFWYQFLLVFVSVAGTSIAFRFVMTHERARRAVEKSARENGATQ